MRELRAPLVFARFVATVSPVLSTMRSPDVSVAVCPIAPMDTARQAHASRAVHAMILFRLGCTDFSIGSCQICSVLIAINRHTSGHRVLQELSLLTWTGRPVPVSICIPFLFRDSLVISMLATAVASDSCKAGQEGEWPSVQSPKHCSNAAVDRTR